MNPTAYAKPAKLPGAGQKHGPFTIVIEVGPITYHNLTKGQAKARHRELRNDIDRFARTLLSVGPYSSVVRTRTEE